MVGDEAFGTVCRGEVILQAEGEFEERFAAHLLVADTEEKVIEYFECFRCRILGHSFGEVASGEEVDLWVWVIGSSVDLR